MKINLFVGLTVLYYTKPHLYLNKHYRSNVLLKKLYIIYIFLFLIPFERQLILRFGSNQPLFGYPNNKIAIFKKNYKPCWYSFACTV